MKRLIANLSNIFTFPLMISTESNNILNAKKNEILNFTYQHIQQNINNSSRLKADLHDIAINNQFITSEQLIQYINANANKFLNLFYTIASLNDSDINILKNNINELRDISIKEISCWLIKNIDEKQLLTIIYDFVKNISLDIFPEFISHPKDFINLPDNTTNKNIVYSTIFFENFPHIHDNYVIVSDEVTESATVKVNKNIKAVGSVFNNAVILDLIYKPGELMKIKNLLKEHGYAKVYINNKQSTGKEYKRIAKINK